MIRETYRGWLIHAYRQVHWPPYLDFVAVCFAPRGMSFNVEGDSLADVMAKAKAAIDKRSG